MDDDLDRIPCVMMRGGTSKGPFFLARDLPTDAGERDRLLVEIMGSGNFLQIDGLGGGNPLSSKVAIVGPSSRPDADVDYLFAQVHVDTHRVDTAPNCGNMLSAVPSFAISAGLVAARSDETIVRVHNLNTHKIIRARLPTPGGRLQYQGDAAIDGVPGSASPVYLTFTDAFGAQTGKLLPTGNAVDEVWGKKATLIDGATTAVLLNAAEFGLTGSETSQVLNANADFLAQLESVRREAGRLMGLGDVASSVLPKPILIGSAKAGGTLSARYFTPWSCHASMATTGAVTIAMAATTPGTVVAQSLNGWSPTQDLILEHPSGQMQLHLEVDVSTTVPSVSLMRTCRRLFEGSVLVRGRTNG